MPPVSYESGHHEAELMIELGLWNRIHKLGKMFSSQTMFVLPDGEKRMPDAAWISNEKDNALPKKERKTFASIVPDFVTEIASPTDSIPALRHKMRAVWIANGVQLAWLFDIKAKKTYIFDADGIETIVEGFTETLSGDPVMPGFVFDLSIFK